MSEKLQKVLARAGLGSRREMERLIAEGRVSVDGRAAAPGDRVEPGQRIRVDGRLLSSAVFAFGTRVLLYYKPVGELCARRDVSGRPTVFDRLPRPAAGRWVAVGRLDLNSAGLLLLTTDGELAARLMHPRHEVEREYMVRVLGPISERRLARLRAGVRLDDGPARFESVRIAGGTGANRWFRVVLKRGRHREVRRLWAAVGCTVSRLIRIRYGPVVLPRTLRPGQWRELGAADIERLRRAAPERMRAASRRF